MMPDPERLFEYSFAAQRLAAANQRDRAPDAVRARVVTTLGLAVGTTVVASTMAGTASASSSTLSASSAGAAAQSGVFAKLSVLAAKGIALKTIGGVVLVGGTMYGAATAVSKVSAADPDASPRPVSIAAAVPVRPLPVMHGHTLAPAERSTPPERQVQALDITDLPLALSASTGGTTRSNAPSERATAAHGRTKEASKDANTDPSKETSSLEDELGLIHRARQELNRGNHSAARITLRQYENRFAQGKLRPEADALRSRLGNR